MIVWTVPSNQANPVYCYFASRSSTSLSAAACFFRIRNCSPVSPSASTANRYCVFYRSASLWPSSENRFSTSTGNRCFCCRKGCSPRFCSSKIVQSVVYRVIPRYDYVCVLVRDCVYLHLVVSGLRNSSPTGSCSVSASGRLSASTRLDREPILCCSNGPVAGSKGTDSSPSCWPW